MKIVHAWPPNIDQIARVFPQARGRRGVIFAYGDTLYVPGGELIPHALRVHEETHGRQQTEIGVRCWWDRYLADPKFRLKQEVEAYHAQYLAMSRPERDRNIRFLAGTLASSLYGCLVSAKAARQLIRTGRMP